MKTLYIKPEEKDITEDMLDDLEIIYENGKKIYNLGYFIKDNKIYKAYYIIDE